MAIASKLVKHLFKPAPQPNLNPYWYWLQGIALSLSWSSIFVPAAAGGLMITFLWRRGWRELDTVVNRGWLGFAGWIVITIAFAHDKGSALSGSVLFLPFLLLFAITAAIIRTAAQLKHFLWLLTLSTIPVGIMGILQAVINRPDWIVPRLFKGYFVTFGLSNDGRVDSIFGYYNEAGIYLAMLLPIIAYFVLGKHKPTSADAVSSAPDPDLEVTSDRPKWYENKRLWAIFALVISLATIYLTKSRNAWGLAIVAIFSLAAYYRYWLIVVLLMLAALVIGWAVLGPIFGFGGEWLRSLLPSAIIDRLVSTIDPNQQDFGSTSERLNAWQFALKLIATRPISGWGLFNFVLVAPLFNYDLLGLKHEHNFFLSITVGLGIPGLLALLGMWGWVSWLGWRAASDRHDKSTKDAIVMALMGFLLYLLSGFLDVIYNEPRINMLSWMLLAAVYGVSRSLSQTPVLDPALNYADADRAPLAPDRSRQDERDDNGQSA
ncbi:O-antigen polymerase [Thalassoporum mexicanum PCC 7367]|uniref:O-antigen ligase family protein n=1 Tax=Thalassoporum mexicanum TaxID=3457544 RepID=UPI00029FC7A4|nr:O-antigen ligase family protein [Pseudanabaena sp. PCC 7367]AFY68435.1 O-antigen polymerase [Pseudanabaena sp. PCC 7367]